MLRYCSKKTWKTEKLKMDSPSFSDNRSTIAVTTCTHVLMASTWHMAYRLMPQHHTCHSQVCELIHVRSVGFRRTHDQIGRHDDKMHRRFLTARHESMSIEALFVGQAQVADLG